MPRSPKAKRPIAATHEPSVAHSKTIENAVRPAVEIQERRPASPVQWTRTRVNRRPQYHEKASFLERESFKGLGLGTAEPYSTWFPGTTLGESYRVADTIFQAAHQASRETRPVSWGYGYTDGALGHNNTRRVVEMKTLVSFRRSIVRAVSAGDRLSLFLTDDNCIFQSGRLFEKQDGCNMWKPDEIKLENRATIVAVTAGHLAAYAVDDQGRLYSWGTQIFGQLGHGEELEQEVSIQSEEDTANPSIEDRQASDNPDDEIESEGEPPVRAVVVERHPRLVEDLNGHSIVKISAGNHFAVALTSTGLVFSWGRGCFGQLGNGDVADNSSPARIEALKDSIAIDISAGMSHVVGVFVPRGENHSSNQHEESLATEHTVVMVWGRGKHGCLGLGGSSNELLPRENIFFRGLGAVKVAAGTDHSLVLCRAGAQTFVYAFGGNHLGQLGIASSADHVDMPSFLDEFVNVHVADIGAGAHYSAALTGDGQVFTWGDARYGKTCRADGRTTYVPWNVDLPSNIPSSTFVSQLSVGSHHCLAQLRIGGQIDRWRKFPLGGILPALSHKDQSSKVSVCQCNSSQTTTHNTLGIFIQCDTCHVSPLCRVCSRRCHRGHVLQPTAIGRGLQRACSCPNQTTSTRTSCLFTSRLPPLIPEDW
ncbi:Regulator of chromosome condensation (RCC1) repeat [Phytophthora infestans]|uniref:Regulator of chromosome condensation (RCC1) repeat n=1 Tax=Phytophthora infestans TaxID=4787 RepID=A0A8S9TXX3_PHYIN|nr:Regulator of chromosome condensation (RCC1) repeat [Phytophthora infestans]